MVDVRSTCLPRDAPPCPSTMAATVMAAASSAFGSVRTFAREFDFQQMPLHTRESVVARAPAAFPPASSASATALFIAAPRLRDRRFYSKLDRQGQSDTWLAGAGRMSSRDALPFRCRLLALARPVRAAEH